MEKMVTEDRLTMVDHAPYSKAQIELDIVFANSAGVTGGRMSSTVNFENIILIL
tara:strand:- start:2747 stop:2908 length:162 start_codon:yes stop_codon:yes gene_type:complete